MALNTLDLPVTESIWRLLDEGETCADIGANIGYMTSVMAARLRRGGTVWAFEPHPALAKRLRAHVAAWSQSGGAKIKVCEQAVSDSNGTAELHSPAEWALNHGTASLAVPPDVPQNERIQVKCGTLDDFFEDHEAPQLLKVDVEGWEANVFRGGARLLVQGKIRDIIFEELRPLPAESMNILREHGYAIFRISRRFSRPALVAVDAPARGELDVPSFLATRDPTRAQVRFNQLGWYALWNRMR